MGYNDERRFPDFSYITKNGNVNEMIDCLVISHFHLDHCGALPYFTEMIGYDGPIYMTAPTKAICPLLLEDYRKITVERKGDSNFFTAQMVKDCMKKVTIINLHESIKVCDDLEIKAYYAGHVLGACLFKITIGSNSIVYTGDYNMTPDRHLGAAWIDKCKPDILITETTYATAIRESKRSREQNFLKKVHECVLEGGKVLIPVFALGRAQELCILIESFWERMGLKIPIYFSTGMTSKANNFYKVFINWTNEKIKKNFVERNMFDFNHIKPWESHYADNPGPMVLFASPGMLHAGTSLTVFKKWAPDPKNMVILPGYCVAGTVGHKVLAGDKIIEVDRYSKINVNLRVENLSFSAHADAKGIMQMIAMCEPKNVMFVHGEKEKMKYLARQIEDEIKIPVYYPPNGKTVTINTKRNIKVDLSVDVIKKSLDDYLAYTSTAKSLDVVNIDKIGDLQCASPSEPLIDENRNIEGNDRDNPLCYTDVNTGVSNLNRIKEENVNFVKQELKQENMVIDDPPNNAIKYENDQGIINSGSLDVKMEDGNNIKQEIQTNIPQSHIYIKEENIKDENINNTSSSQNSTNKFVKSEQSNNINVNNNHLNENNNGLDNDKKRKRDANDKSSDENLKLKIRKFDNRFIPGDKNKMQIDGSTTDTITNLFKPIANVPIKYMKPIRHLPFRGVIMWDMNNDTNTGRETSLTQRSRWNEGSWYMNENKSDINYEVQGESFQDFDRQHIKVVSDDTMTNDLGLRNKKIRFCIRKKNYDLKKLLQKLKKINKDNEKNSSQDTLALNLLLDIKKEHLEEELKYYDSEDIKEGKDEDKKKEKKEKENEQDIKHEKNNEDTLEKGGEKEEKKEEEEEEKEEGEVIEENEMEKEKEEANKKYDRINIEDQILIELKYYILDNLITKKRINRKLHENKSFVFRDSFNIPINSNYSSSLQPQNQITLRVEGESALNLLTSSTGLIYSETSNDQPSSSTTFSSYNNKRSSKDREKDRENKDREKDKEKDSSSKTSHDVKSVVNDIEPCISLHEIYLLTRSRKLNNRQTSPDKEDDESNNKQKGKAKKEDGSKTTTPNQENQVKKTVKNKGKEEAEDDDDLLDHDLEDIYDDMSEDEDEISQNSNEEDEYSILTIRSVEVRISPSRNIVKISWNSEDELIAEEIINLF